jgi:hypothetical protein
LAGRRRAVPEADQLGPLLSRLRHVSRATPPPGHAQDPVPCCAAIPVGWDSITGRYVAIPLRNAAGSTARQRIAGHYEVSVSQDHGSARAWSLFPKECSSACLMSASASAPPSSLPASIGHRRHSTQQGRAKAWCCCQWCRRPLLHSLGSVSGSFNQPATEAV